MPVRHRPVLSALIPVLILSIFFLADLGAEPVQVGHVRAELIAETDSIVPGQPFRVGLHLVMDEHWHVYWRNPGDAGLPPKIKWNLPEGFTASQIQWPYPDRFEVPPLVSFGFYDSVLLPVEITPPQSLSDRDQIEISADAEWLACKEECIPGQANLSLSMPNGSQAGINERHADLFNHVDRRIPLSGSGWQVFAAVENDYLILSLKQPEWFEGTLSDIYFFPYEKGIIDNSHKQELTAADNGFLLNIKLAKNIQEIPDSIAGILISDSGWRGTDSEKAIAFSAEIGYQPDTPQAVASIDQISIWKALLFAFLGGIILNLMPCVLPVLSLKILGFVNQAGENRARVFAHGAVFTSGVLISFWILAGALILLQAGGQQLGWGFQLQSPEFIMILSGFMFLFGLNLLGVFEMGTSLTTVGGRSAGKGGWSGSFLNGITATIVATPCTAPFMGTALGFTITQSALISFAVFTALGLGMSAPYLIISAFPALLKFIPKPGRWMETLKHIMGFLLLATVIWLSWVLGIQGGANAVIVLMIVLLLLGIAAWIYGRWSRAHGRTVVKVAAYSFSIVLVVTAIVFGVTGLNGSNMAMARNISSSQHGLIEWHPFSEEKIAELKSAGKPIFIDFTAAWCLSCQVNEQVAFGSRKVQERFADLGITAIKADWTSRDERITRALAKYGRNSVPLYILYGEGAPDDPIILPQILTPGVVLEALQKIDS